MMVNQRSILDTPITFPEQQRSAIETVDLIAKAVSQSAGVRLEFAAGPLNLLANTSARLGATNEVARDILMRTLVRTNRKLSWRVFYSAGGREYILSIHGVQ